jgi:hypothetical protein
MKNIALIISAFSILFFSCNITAQKNNATIVFPEISNDSLLTLIEYKTFQYFWDGAEPVSGMARERFHLDGNYPENDKNVVTTGGSGFGVMAILVGIKRGFISREEGFQRLYQIIDFLKRADRFHGVWPHWLYGETGKTKPFSPKDDGADLVETSYLMQGLLCARQYFLNGNVKEKTLVLDIDKLWKEVEWTWFTRNGQDVLYWHWSPNFAWDMNLPIEGYNECLITYILAASSPTYPIEADVYHKGWARKGAIKIKHEKYGHQLALKHNFAEEYGGPLFWAHYSFLGLDPRNLSDQYVNYWQHNTSHTLINRQWCIENPNHYKGYSSQSWGLTSSYSLKGYAGHAPGKESDLGVISPTAALASFPYTPEYSMEALKYFYYGIGDKILGKYGFYDAFSEHHNWYPQKYLAIDQGPEIVMIENYRSAMLWDLFMSCPEVKVGLDKLGFKFTTP